MKRVGYWLSDKKTRKLGNGFHQGFEPHCRKAGIDLVKLDLNRPIEDQGPFDVILHKISDVMVAADDMGNVQAQNQMHNFSNYIKQHPEVAVIDPIDKVRALLDRYKQYKLVEECDFEPTGTQVIIPNFVELTTKDANVNKQLLEMAGVKYPFVCKSTIAQYHNLAHKMAIIFSERGLLEITDFPSSCVAQTFVNHDARLYKVFVIGDVVHVVHRPSIKNFYQSDNNQETIFFDSSDVSKQFSSCDLNQLDDFDLDNSPIRPNYDLLNDISQAMRIKLGLDLFGIDIIIENKTGSYAVIDINVFPGYDGVPKLFEALLSLVKNALDKRLQTTNGDTSASKIDTVFCHQNIRKNHGDGNVDDNQKIIAAASN